MRISARVDSSPGDHSAEVTTDGTAVSVAIGARSPLPGSAVSGGELLFLALATCFGNDVYREAARRGLRIDGVAVEVDGSFDGPGDPARDVSYRVRVVSPEDPERIRELLRHTDGIAEVHGTVRSGTPVLLAGVEVASA